MAMMYSLQTFNIIWLYRISLGILLMSFNNMEVNSQRTDLDNAFGNLYRPIRLFLLNIINSLTESNNINDLTKKSKFQNTWDTFHEIMMCDGEHGPGKRSLQRPNSVHRLRPGDIDIIAAMGDSLTAGNAILGNTLLDNMIENRGLSWSIGGQGNWSQYLTIPNILKVFNKNLYGYSLKDGLSTDRSSRFNVAELGAMSRDMPYMAKILVKRLKHDRNVNIENDWKLITLNIGSNDFCSDICFYQNPNDTIKWHENNMLITFRYLRDNLPRLILNVVPPPYLSFFVNLNDLPMHCYLTLRFECPCILGKPQTYVNYMESIMKKWNERLKQITLLDEFNNDTFTINYQPFSLNFTFPLLSDGHHDTSISSFDCFHLSQKGQAVSFSYWNNLLQTAEEKGPLLFGYKEKFKCPTYERPFLITRVNSQSNFSI